ncbi:MAG: M55 family metallopeptidase [Lentisphaeria bacterium]|nr:M55 family metallopeptidase [Lentisphaeria bacterium]
MKVYIQTDIEGVAGFCFFENRKDKNYENILHRQRMYRLFTAEVNAAVTAAFESGADEVYVNDSHGTGYNLIFEELDSRCKVIHGDNCSGPHWLPKLDSTFDAVVLIGMHAMGGTKCAITAHSLWVVNDGAIKLSEGTMAAAIAGDFGVPAVCVSGDDKICAEFAEKIDGIETAVVKEALAPHQACTLMPEASRKLIAEKVKKGLANLKNIKPFKIAGPVKLALYDSDNHAPPLKQIGEAVTADNMNEAFLKYEKAMPWTKFDSEEPYGFVFPY